MNPDLIQNQPEPKDYIGDGVYIRHDGYDTILTAENGVEVLHRIVLDPEVFSSMLRFIERVNGAHKPKEQLPYDNIPESVATMVCDQREKAGKHKAAEEWMVRNAAALNSLAAEGITPSFYGWSLEFDYLSHEKVMMVVKAFPGRWAKELSYNGDKIDYSIKFDGMDVKCCAGEPPPSCRIIEEEIEVPATKRKVRRLECHPDIISPAPTDLVDPIEF